MLSEIKIPREVALRPHSPSKNDDTTNTENVNSQISFQANPLQFQLIGDRSIMRMAEGEVIKNAPDFSPGVETRTKNTYIRSTSGNNELLLKLQAVEVSNLYVVFTLDEIRTVAPYTGELNATQRSLRGATLAKSIIQDYEKNKIIQNNPLYIE